MVDVLLMHHVVAGVSSTCRPAIGGGRGSVAFGGAGLVLRQMIESGVVPLHG